MISEHRSGQLLNRKGEWGQNLPPQFGILGNEDEEGRGLRPEREKRVRKKRSRQEDRQEEGEVGKTPSKKDRKDRKDPSPPDLGMAVQLGRQDEDQIIIEKPQVHSVKSYFIQASLSKHELLGPREKHFRGAK